LHIIKKLLQGVLVGVSLVLPGMSAGTAFILLGRYRRFIDDLSALNLKPYMVLATGAAGGVILCAFFIESLLDDYPNLVVSFLMGMLLASVTLVLKPLDHKKFRGYHAVPVMAGLFLAWNVVGEPLTRVSSPPVDSLALILLAGVVVSATMLLPGVSGSSLLIMMNLYDDMLYFVNHLVWPQLLVFSAGVILGVLVFSRVISYLYYRNRYLVAFFLSGLLIGSTRALIPEQLVLEVVISFLAGAGLVIFLSRKTRTSQNI